jgi:putative spermidine/putrescine transport system substrate-binding protein
MSARRERDPAKVAWAIVVALVLALVGIGCGDDDDEGDGGSSSGDGGSVDTSDLPQEVGEGEGELNLIAWAGYVEDGSTDPDVDWVTDFEKETGCQVEVKIGNTSDDIVCL